MTLLSVWGVRKETVNVDAKRMKAILWAVLAAAVGTYIGEFIDGNGHRFNSTGYENIFVKEHWLLYGGIATMLALVTFLLWNWPKGQPLPVSVKLLRAGALVLLVGAIGDGATHTLFGFRLEEGWPAEATLTHLMLATGIAGIPAGVGVWAWEMARGKERLTWLKDGMIYIAFLLVSAMLSALPHASVPFGSIARMVTRPDGDVWLAGQNLQTVVLFWALAMPMVLVFLARRTRTPWTFGFWWVLGVAIFPALFDYKGMARAMLAAAATGIVAEVMLRVLDFRKLRDCTLFGAVSSGISVATCLLAALLTQGLWMDAGSALGLIATAALVGGLAGAVMSRVRFD
jgi:hypothetical protein